MSIAKLRELAGVPEFTWKTIEGVAQWQAGSRTAAIKTKFLESALLDLPDSVKTYTGDLFRGVFMNKKEVRLLLSGSLPCRPLESWATTLKDVNTFVSGAGDRDSWNDYQVACVFNIKATSKNVALDLSALWKYKPFVKSYESYIEQGRYFAKDSRDDVDDIRGHEKEVVVRNPVLKPSQLISVWYMNDKQKVKSVVGKDAMEFLRTLG